MKEAVKHTPPVDWQLMVSLLFWFAVIAGFASLISHGRPEIPIAELEVTEASASREKLIIAHRDGDAVRFANTRCVWTPDVSFPENTEEAGSLVLSGKERKQGIVSMLETGETAALEKPISMKNGTVGRILIIDRMSGLPLFSRPVIVTE